MYDSIVVPSFLLLPFLISEHDYFKLGIGGWEYVV